MAKHFGKAIEAEAHRKHNEGVTVRELAKLYDLTFKQMEQLLTRYRAKLKRIEAGIPPGLIGRPFKSKASAKTELQQLEDENRRLKREIEMIRDFLRDVGRR